MSDWDEVEYLITLSISCKFMMNCRYSKRDEIQLYYILSIASGVQQYVNCSEYANLSGTATILEPTPQ